MEWRISVWSDTRKMIASSRTARRKDICARETDSERLHVAFYELWVLGRPNHHNVFLLAIFLAWYDVGRQITIPQFKGGLLLGNGVIRSQSPFGFLSWLCSISWNRFSCVEDRRVVVRKCVKCDGTAITQTSHCLQQTDRICLWNQLAHLRLSCPIPQMRNRESRGVRHSKLASQKGSNLLSRGRAIFRVSVILQKYIKK
jgi:hypothetical protein